MAAAKLRLHAFAAIAQGKDWEGIPIEPGEHLAKGETVHSDESPTFPLSNMHKH